MGTFKKGILGGFSGKVGTVVGSNWRGLDVMRSLPKRSKSSITQLQASQRQRFALAMEFLSPLTTILTAYFGSPSGTSSRLNNAASYHLKEAIVGDSPNYGIDYSKVIVSKGELIGVKNAAVTAPVAGGIHVAWDDNSDQVLARSTDLLLLVAYNPDKSQFVIAQGPATREDATAAIGIPNTFGGDTLHVWIAFVNPDSQKAATSLYFGTLQAN